jgi:hypothetical protein
MMNRKPTDWGKPIEWADGFNRHDHGPPGVVKRYPDGSALIEYFHKRTSSYRAVVAAPTEEFIRNVRVGPRTFFLRLAISPQQAKALVFESREAAADCGARSPYSDEIVCVVEKLDQE